MTTLHGLSWAQKLILSVITITTISVVAISVYALFGTRSTDNTSTIEAYISSLAADYYENYFFPDLESSIHEHGTSDISEVLSKYTDTGFSKVPLRQILFHTTQDGSITDTISDRCDVNTTFVHFFPEPPFVATSYHATYDYSCNF